MATTIGQIGSKQKETILLDTAEKFQENVILDDYVSISFAHTYKDGNWSDWVEHRYQFKEYNSGTFYLINSNGDVLRLTKGGFGIKSMIIQK